MPQATSVTYTRNTVRVTMRTYTWADLQASADAIKVSVFKIEGQDLIALPMFQDITPDGTRFREVQAGEYQFLLDTNTMSTGEFRVIFEGTIGGSGFYEPVLLTLKTVKSELERR